MKIVILSLAGIILISCFAMAQYPTPGYYLIYGSRNGSNVDVNIDSDIKIEVWATTPDTSSYSVIFMHTPLASNDSFIVSRDGGEVFFPLTNWCWDVNFFPANPDSTPGYTNQSIIGWFHDEYPGGIPLNTQGDTIHIATFLMHTTSDSSVLYQSLPTFKEGFRPENNGLLWVLSDYTTHVFPLQTFSCLNFVDYLPGDANSSGDVNGLDIIYMVGYLKGYFPPPEPIFAGDANGDCLANGLDIIYLINFFKGGPEPFLGNCH